MAGSKRTLSAAEGVAMRVGGFLASHHLRHDYGVAARTAEIEIRKVCHGVVDVQMEFFSPYDQPLNVRVQLADRREIFGADVYDEDPEIFRAQISGGDARTRGEEIRRAPHPKRVHWYNLEDLKQIEHVDKFCMPVSGGFSGSVVLVACDGGRRVLKKVCRNLDAIRLNSGEWMEYVSFENVDQYILAQEWSEAAASSLTAAHKLADVKKLVARENLEVHKTSAADRAKQKG